MTRRTRIVGMPVPISRRALLARLKRRLAEKGQDLRAYRGGREQAEEFAIIRLDTKKIVRERVTMKELLAEFQVIEPFESVEE